MKEIGFNYTFDENNDKSVHYFNKKLDNKVKECLEAHTDIDLVRLYSEWAKPYGHAPYMTIYINIKPNQDQHLMKSIIKVVLDELVEVDITDTHSARYR